MAFADLEKLWPTLCAFSKSKEIPLPEYDRCRAWKLGDALGRHGEKLCAHNSSASAGTHVAESAQDRTKSASQGPDHASLGCFGAPVRPMSRRLGQGRDLRALRR